MQTKFNSVFLGKKLIADWIQYQKQKDQIFHNYKLFRTKSAPSFPTKIPIATPMPPNRTAVKI